MTISIDHHKFLTQVEKLLSNIIVKPSEKQVLLEKWVGTFSKKK